MVDTRVTASLGEIAHNGAAASRREQIFKQSQKVVAKTFFGPVLKQMHNGAFHSELFSGGKAGRSFEAVLDDRLAERMSNAPVGQKLAGVMTRKWLKAHHQEDAAGVSMYSRMTRTQAPPRLKAAADSTVDVTG